MCKLQLMDKKDGTPSFRDLLRRPSFFALFTTSLLQLSIATMIIPGREVRPAYLALSVGAFATFVFVSFVSFRDSSHLTASIREKVHQYK